MAVIIHFKDGSTATLANGQDSVPVDAHYMEITGGGGIHVALVPTANVLFLENTF